ncbi:MAG: copper-translocating P-type ATPase [Anaerolineales bacterium]|uniref:Copper-translocating P-type ATPase n=1 Tax=Candidatus Desulfolinea nitratireducens TaxID=2841698 RepID=A0A8J6TGD4_9CHLR|nr:copper-translocating P-type ATPase [Candidatus Desulfolinea nitratireducens]
MDDKHKMHDMQEEGNEHPAHQEYNQHEGHQMHSRDEEGMDYAEHSGKKEGHDEHAGHTDHSGHEQMFRQRFWISSLISIPVLLYSPSIQNWFGFSMPIFPGSDWITPILAVIIFFYGGLPFLKMAVPEIKTRKPGMMTLISLAIGVAFIYSIIALFLPTESGFFWELVTLIDIMLLGHWMEMRSVRQASGALNALAKLLPDTAERIEAEGQVREVPVASLQKDDLLLVRPGASVPADGEVVDGNSDVNESMITGESLPVSKGQGDQVIAGTINGDGSLRVRVNALGDETALAGIMRLVEQAQQSKSDTQILADKAAGWLFYIALGVAALTAVLWTIGVGFSVEVVARVATVLVIACPHALGLAVPLVVAITTSMGAENGILVRDRLALETAREINTVIFDKTGTLTLGEFGVVGIATAEGWKESDALALAAAIEGDSEHTIARGIRRTAEVRGLTLPKVSDFEAIKGRGVKAISGGESVHIGGPRLLEMLSTKLPVSLADFEKRTSARGQSSVYLFQNEKAVAAFALADVIRPESKAAIKKLHSMNIQVAMLTGDSRAVAETVAEELGIDQVFAEVLPEEKDQKVAALQSQGRKVAMVGDGVNDAPALTRADVGIAIGGGTDVAIESAGIVLVKSNPLDVVKIFALSRASYRKMIQNLWWAAGYNIIALPLAAGILAPWGILLSPAVGAALMSLSTVVVAINAQLLRRSSLMA